MFLTTFQTISLKKDQSINLSKLNTVSKLEQLHVGLGWDTHNQVRVDLDSFVIQLDSENNELDTLCFTSSKKNGKPCSEDGAMIHSGDNLTGEGYGDDEIILIHLNQLNPNTKRLIVAVNIFTFFSKKITFNQIQNAYVRLLNAQTNESLIRYELSQDDGNNYAMIVGEFVKNEDGSWEFKAIGEATKDRGINDVKKRFTEKKSMGTEQDTKKKKGFLSGWFN